MSVTYRGAYVMTADPAEVRDVFLRSGWRGLERNYGSSSAVIMQLIARAGGAALLAERAAIQGNGRRAGVTRKAALKSIKVESNGPAGR